MNSAGTQRGRIGVISPKWDFHIWDSYPVFAPFRINRGKTVLWSEPAELPTLGWDALKRYLSFLPAKEAQKHLPEIWIMKRCKNLCPWSHFANRFHMPCGCKIVLGVEVWIFQFFKLMVVHRISKSIIFLNKNLLSPCTGTEANHTINSERLWIGLGDWQKWATSEIWYNCWALSWVF